MICHALVVMMCLVIIARMTVVFRVPRARRAINLKRHRKASVTCDTSLTTCILKVSCCDPQRIFVCSPELTA
jgi:hypothetical protein